MSNIASTGYWDGNNPEHAMSEPLSNWIIEYLKDQKSNPIYDFGCGKGMYLAKLSKAGFTSLCGFEGDPPKNKVFENILKQDLTTPFVIPIRGNIISLEVAEHIPSHLTDIYLTNIYNACMKDGIFISSWAVRGQGGHGHCNELNNDEALKLIIAKGFKFLSQDTEAARKNISIHQDIPNGHLPWFKGTTLIFKKV
jgi:SAM-dependent methyltransferase